MTDRRQFPRGSRVDNLDMSGVHMHSANLENLTNHELTEVRSAPRFAPRPWRHVALTCGRAGAPHGDRFTLMGRFDLEGRIRAICMALPGVTERMSHGTPAFFVGKQFLMLWPDGHHDHEFAHLWCAAPPGVQAELVTTEPERFFRPPYVGGRGWVGFRLDGRTDWEEVTAVCEEAFRTVASKKLIAALDLARD
jgi:hypothetical protein